MTATLRHTPPFPKVFVAVLGYATLFFVAFPGYVACSPARLDMLWERADTAAMFVDFVLVSLVAAIVLWGVDKATKGRFFRVGRYFLPFFCAVALMQLLPQQLLRSLHLDKFGIWMPYVCIAFLGVVASVVAFRKRWDGALSAMAGFLPVFVLMLPLFALQFLFFQPFVVGRSLNERPLPPSASGNPNILFFSFDSIALENCLEEDGSWRRDLPATRSFQESAIRFDAAVAPGTHTMGSVPNLLFQSPRPYSLREERIPDGLAHIHTNGLFRLAKSAGYRTAAISQYVPLGQLMAPFLDEVMDIPYRRYVPATSFFNRCVNHFVAMVDYVRPRFDAFARNPGRRLPWLPHRLSVGYGLWIVRTELEAVLAHIARLPPSGELFYAHLAGAHPPLVLLEDGTVDENHATFDSQLRFTDSAFGTLLDALRSQGRFDSSWVFFTADHAFHHPDATSEQLRHVPFVVKPPHWARPVVCDAPVNLWEIPDFFKAIMEGLPTEDCLELLAPEVFSYPTPSRQHPLDDQDT